MSAGKHFSEDACAIAVLAGSDPERIAAERHADQCTGCASALAEARVILALLDALPPHPLPRAVSDGLTDLVKADLARERRSFRVATAMTLVVGCAFAILAKHHAHDALSWIEAAVILVMALVYTIAARTPHVRAATAGTVATSAVLVLVAAAGGALLPRLGIKCTLIELVAAALPYACVAVASVRRRAAASPWRFAVVAGAGALAGQASLQVTCAAHGEEPHLVVFHLGGVLLATVLGALGARMIGRRARLELA